MSYWTSAIKAMKRAVSTPITSTSEGAVCESSKSGDIRATMKMPAVTMVAAWIRAEIGVGPSIESGSHTWRGNCADFPIAPMKSPIQIAERSSHGDLYRRSEEHTSELQSRENLVCRLLL